MIIFSIVAAVLALASAVWIARPLWQQGRGRTASILTVLLMSGAAAALYAYSSRWSWPEASADKASTPVQMVSQLARRLEREPNDVEGWLMLGRSYASLGQLPLAQRAYQRADRLESGRNAEALIGMAEAMVMQANGAVDERAGRLFEQALVLEPESEKALFFAAVAAQRRGDTPLAIARFDKMLAMNPPPNIRVILQEQVDRLRAGPDASKDAAGAAAAPGAASSAAASSAASDSVSATAPEVAVTVSVAPSLATAVTPGATLFVFVRAPGRPGPPLAVKRLPARLPIEVRLTAADSMVPGLSFAANDTVEVSAKISADGSATPKSGEPIGRVSYVVGRDGNKPIVIDGRSK